MDQDSDNFATDYVAANADSTNNGATNPMRGGSTGEAVAVGHPRTVGKTSALSPHYSFLDPPLADDELGRLGNYRVLSLLGQGGMAYVFLAEDLTLERKVALKIVKPEINDADDEAGNRFLREARVMASITHQHLVPVYQVGREGRVHYLAMELLKGETLESWSARTGAAKARDILRIAREITTGLAIIHSKGLVHRDLKPSNIWLEDRSTDIPVRPKAKDGQEGPSYKGPPHIKILDMGLARSATDDTCFTIKGTIVGTPAFMSPEQARGERLDARSDLFSLGAVLYRVATGRLPFDAPTTMGVLSALAVCTPLPVQDANPNVPRPLARLIMQLLAKEPSQRPASAQAVLDHLERIETRRTDATPKTAAPAESPRRPRSSIKKREATSVLANRRLVVACLLIFTALATLTGSAVVLGVGIMSLTGSPPADPPPGGAQGGAQSKVLLAQLKPTEMLNWGPNFQPKGPMMEKKGPPKDFVDARIAGQRFPNGILMHAPPPFAGEVAKVSYRLNGQYATFESEVTLNDGPKLSESPLTFTVLGDNKVLWQSKGVVTQFDSQKCSVSVKDVQVLSIQVSCGGDPRGGHGVWIDPCVVK